MGTWRQAVQRGLGGWTLPAGLALALGAPQGAQAGLGVPGAYEPIQLEVLEVSAPRPGLIEGAKGGGDRLPMTIQAAVAVDPGSFSRPLWLRLSAEVWQEGAPVAVVDDLTASPWVALGGSGEGVETVSLAWDLAELDADQQPDLQSYELAVTAHLGVGAFPSAPVEILSAGGYGKGAVERVPVIEPVAPGAALMVEVKDPGSPANGTRVEIPAGAVEGPAGMALSIRVLQTVPAGQSALALSGPVVEVELAGAEFKSPIELTLPWWGSDAKGAMAYYHEPQSAKWIPVAPARASEAGVTVKVDHLSTWATSESGGGAWGIDVSMACDPGLAEDQGRSCPLLEAQRCGGEGEPPCPAWWGAEDRGRRSFWRVRRESGGLPSLEATVRFWKETSAGRVPAALASDSLAWSRALVPADCAIAMHGVVSATDRSDPSALPFAGGAETPSCSSETADWLEITDGAEQDPHYPILLNPSDRVGWSELVVMSLPSEGTAFTSSEATRCSEAVVSYFSDLKEHSSFAPLYECLLLRYDPPPGSGSWSSTEPLHAQLLPPEGVTITAPQDLAPGDPAAPWQAWLVAGGVEGGLQPSPEEAVRSCEARALGGEGALLAATSVDSDGEEATGAITLKLPDGTRFDESNADRVFVALVGQEEGSASDTQGSVSCTPLFVDRDGDGEPGAHVLPCRSGVCPEVDCDDGNAQAYHGNVEVCDGEDNDCNDLKDDGLPQVDVYRDEDGDGVGAGVALPGCEGLPGTAEVAGDCDDQDAGVHPGAEEACNGLDDDCDGAADVGLRGDLFLDADGDGYGGLPAPVCVEAGAEVVSVGSDCDDGDARIHPGGPAALWLGPSGAVVSGDCGPWSARGVLPGGWDLDGDGEADALGVAPGAAPGNLQAVLEAAVRAGTLPPPAGSRAPGGLALHGGRYRETLSLGDGAALSLVGVEPGVVLDAGGDACLARAGEAGEACSGVVVRSGARLHLEALTVTGGRGTLGSRLGVGSAQARYGGGAAVVDGGRLTAEGVTIEGNRAHFGAGVYLRDAGEAAAPIRLKGCDIRGNVTGDTRPIGPLQLSGAVLGEGSWLSLTLSEVADNVRELGAGGGAAEPPGAGAGLALVHGGGEVVGNVFTGNEGFSASSIAVLARVGEGRVRLINNTVEEGLASGMAGGVGVMALSPDGAPGVAAVEVVGNAVVHNAAASAGGLAVVGEPITALEGNLVSLNEALWVTGGLYLSAPGQEAHNNTFDRNGPLPGAPSGDTLPGDLLVEGQAPEGEEPPPHTGHGGPLEDLALPAEVAALLAPSLARAAAPEAQASAASAAAATPSAAADGAPRTLIGSSLFLPRLDFLGSVSCGGGDFRYDLFWDAQGLGPLGCEALEGGFLLWEEGYAPVAQWRPELDWYEVDYRLIPGARDTGDPNPARSDPDGSRDDPGHTGGVWAGRGVGAVASGCAAEARQLSGILLDPRGEMAGALTPRDLPLYVSADLSAPRQDLYLLWGWSQLPRTVTVTADTFQPEVAIFGPELLRYGPEEEWGPTFACGAGDALPAEGQGGQRTFTPQADGYQLIRVASQEAGGLGPYEMEWE